MVDQVMESTRTSIHLENLIFFVGFGRHHHHFREPASPLAQPQSGIPTKQTLRCHLSDHFDAAELNALYDATLLQQVSI